MNRLENFDLKKPKKCINYRLLKYPLNGYDYTKINNKAYNKQKYTMLIVNYLWWNYKNLDLVTKALIKYSKQRIFNIINNDFPFLILEYEKEYNLDFYTTEKYRILKFEKEPRICKHCANKVLTNNIYCSVKCSNQYKATDEKYLNNLSNSQKKYYIHADKNDLKSRHESIKSAVVKFNSNLTSLEKSVMYTNKTLIYDSFENRKEQFNNLTFLFDKDFYYNNKYLPVSCNKCGFEWELTRSTSMGRTICTKCVPQEKAKTQRKIFEYIYELTYCKNNDKSFIKDLEIDILVDSHKFGIEYNGLLPHSFGDSKIKHYNNRKISSKYHLNKTELVEEKDYQLFHIFENEWLNIKKQQIWISMLNNKLNLSEKIFARKCIIKEINYLDSYEFLGNNHMQGSCNSSIKIGLYYEEMLVSVMTFRKHKEYEWEIARFTNKLNYNIVGGASKLLKYFERAYNPKTLLSYANRRWSKGNSAPNHFYFKLNENILYPREKFQKHKLKSILSIFDENKSGIENMFNNGYRIIYDCGSKKYIKYY